MAHQVTNTEVKKTDKLYGLPGAVRRHTTHHHKVKRQDNSGKQTAFAIGLYGRVKAQEWGGGAPYFIKVRLIVHKPLKPYIYTLLAGNTGNLRNHSRQTPLSDCAF